MTGIPNPGSLPVPARPAIPSGFDAFASRLFVPPAAVQPAQARRLLVVAGLLAVWTDVLFYRAGLGVNVTLWFASLAGAAVYASSVTGRPMARDRLVVLATAVALSVVFAWRDAEALQFFSLVATLGLLAIAFGLPSGTAVRRLSPVSCAIALASCAVALWTAEWRLARRTPWPARDASGSGRARTAARSLVIALPVLLVFGALFAAADAVFAAQVDRLLVLDLSDVWGHLLLLVFGLWFGTAVLWNAAAIDLPPDFDAALPERHRLGRVEIGVVLGSLAVLFALFVVVQVRYLFGGEEAVRASVDLTYAQYARRGFFELVVASMLLLPLLAGIDWARRRDAARLFLALSGVLVVLLFVIMASAWQRLAMYREAFGLTELRFYAAATLPWIGAALLWFLVSVVRRRADLLLSGAIGLAVLTLLVVIVLSPDAFIARTNAARVGSGQEFDAHYAGLLSADAVPPLLDRREALIGALDAEQRCELAMAFREHAAAGDGVRSWNWSRAQAARLIASHPEVTHCE